MKWFSIFLCFMFLIGCAPPKYETYDIQSIRVDDDAELHIIAISKIGEVIALEDELIGTDIEIKYGDYEKPILKSKGKGYFDDIVYLPIGYKIDTFVD